MHSSVKEKSSTLLHIWSFSIPFKAASIGMCMSTNRQFVSEIGEVGYKKGNIIEVVKNTGEGRWFIFGKDSDVL